MAPALRPAVSLPCCYWLRIRCCAVFSTAIPSALSFYQFRCLSARRQIGGIEGIGAVGPAQGEYAAALPWTDLPHVLDAVLVCHEGPVDERHARQHARLAGEDGAEVHDRRPHLKQRRRHGGNNLRRDASGKHFQLQSAIRLHLSSRFIGHYHYHLNGRLLQCRHFVDITNLHAEIRVAASRSRDRGDLHRDLRHPRKRARVLARVPSKALPVTYTMRRGPYW